MFEKLEIVEAIVFMILGIVIEVVAITQSSGIGPIVIGALFIIAGILHAVINVKKLNKR